MRHASASRSRSTRSPLHRRADGTSHRTSAGSPAIRLDRLQAPARFSMTPRRFDRSGRDSSRFRWPSARSLSVDSAHRERRKSNSGPMINDQGCHDSSIPYSWRDLHHRHSQVHGSRRGRLRRVHGQGGRRDGPARSTTRRTSRHRRYAVVVVSGSGQAVLAASSLHPIRTRAGKEEYPLAVVRSLMPSAA